MLFMIFRRTTHLVVRSSLQIDRILRFAFAFTIKLPVVLSLVLHVEKEKHPPRS